MAACNWRWTRWKASLAQRFGVVRAADGSVQRLVVFGLGKLGGGELNFSSDVDLVYAYEHEGESDGARSLARRTICAARPAAGEAAG
jgi:glutamine synthetase adenylyltransferase